MGRATVSVEDLLMRHRAIDDDQLRRAKDHQKKTGGELGRVLVELGYVSEELLLRAQAHQLGIPMVNLDAQPPPRDLALALGEAACKRFGVIPVSGNLENKLLRVATFAPADAQRLATLAQTSGFRIEPAAATSEAIARAIKAAFGAQAPRATPAIPEVHPEPDDDLAGLRERVNALEKSIANPPFAALLARVERLEQIAENDHRALNVLGQVLLDLGLITREELMKRLGR
jgi:hypothetical protein